jgi:hypothetical protein
VRIWRWESHFSQKWPLTNVDESGKNSLNGLANVGESGESAQHGLANVGESGEYSLSLLANVGASVHVKIGRLSTNNIFYMHKMI